MVTKTENCLGLCDHVTMVTIAGRLFKGLVGFRAEDPSVATLLDFTNTHHLHRNYPVEVEKKAALGREPEISGFVLSRAVGTARWGKSLNNSLDDGHHGHMVTVSCCIALDRGDCGSHLVDTRP